MLQLAVHIIDETSPLVPGSTRVFVKAIVPLIGNAYLPLFNDSITTIVNCFLEDNNASALPVILVVIGHFSMGSVASQKCMVGHLGTALGQAPPKALAPYATRLAKILAAACESPAEPVAQAALALWSRNGAIKLLSEFKRIVVPIVVVPIARCMAAHWSVAVQETARHALHSIERQDIRTVQNCLKPGAAVDQQIAAAQTWMAIAHTAATGDPTVSIPMKVGEIAEKLSSAALRADKATNRIAVERSQSTKAKTLAPLVDSC
jgi:hypothetical protein